MKLYPPEKVEEYRQIFQDYGVRGSETTELLVHHSSGRSIPVEISSNIVEFGGRKVIQGIFRDITARKRAKELSDILNNINTAIHSTLNIGQIIKRVVVASAQGIQADAASVAMREDGKWVDKYIYYNLPEDLDDMRLGISELFYTEQITSTKKSLFIEDIYEERRADEYLKQFGVRSILALPLIIRERVIGIISFFYFTKGAQISDEERSFTEKVAPSVSLAIENANFYENQKQVSETLQEALIAIPENIDGINFSHLYRSATEIAKVGGDFYDIFAIEHGKIAIIMGDVSGKGIEATGIASLVKNTINAYAYEDLMPNLVLQKTNEIILRSTEPDTFVTVFFCIWDVSLGVLSYCNGGHPPPVVERADGLLELLPSYSPILGAWSDINYINKQVKLEKGDNLILYSDGIIEARHKSEFFGEERLGRTIKDLRNISTENKASAIYEAVISFSNGMLTDDLALLSVSPKD